MKKLILIILAISFYPFGCEGQVNGTLPGSDGCDTVYVEDPAWDSQVKTFEQMIKDLTDDNAILRANNENLTAQVATLDAAVVVATASIKSRDDEIKSLKSDITSLEEQLASKADTIYKDVIVEVMPSPTVDTVFVTHSNDDKTNRKYFHHGSFEAPFPKDITFETKEFCMITVEFPDSLGTFRTLDKFKVKRIMDHENARTIYEFIE